MPSLFQLCSALVVAAATSSSSSTCVPVYNGVTNPAPGPDPVAPDTFKVAMYTDSSNKEPIVLEVFRDWSPLGVDRFYQLVSDGYYNCAGFFRVVPDFVLQYGIAALPEETEKWNTIIPGMKIVQF
jgi:hypothetical protein